VVRKADGRRQTAKRQKGKKAKRQKGKKAKNFGAAQGRY
jgi:hypothetical protein